jgi:hypothetical protein
MKELGGSIEIDAPVAWVWKALTYFTSYPEWNSFLVSMAGELKVGSVFNVTVRVPGRKDIKFPSQIVNIIEGKELLLKRTSKKVLISNDHIFSLEALNSDRTRFTQKMTYSGIMIPFAGGVIRDSQ